MERDEAKRGQDSIVQDRSGEERRRDAMDSLRGARERHLCRSTFFLAKNDRAPFWI